jgi:Ca2+-binding EF-hand superfamily protein
MKRDFLILALLTALSPWALAAQDPARSADPAAAASDVQDIIFFGDTRPVLIRLHVQVNGKSFRDGWNEFVRDLHKFLDLDGDGTLNQAEAERTPLPQVLFAPNVLLGGTNPVALRTLDADRDGKVALEELALYYRQSGGGPFQAQWSQSQPPLGDALTNALYEQLDTNNDAKLSQEELAAAAVSLLKLDLSDDEVVAAAELAPIVSQAANQVVVSRAQTVAGSLPDDAAFYAVNPDEPAERVARRFQIRYGSPDSAIRNRQLTREQIGLDQAAFDQLDGDHDGKLNTDELAKFAARTPDVEFIVRLGTQVPGGVGAQLTSPEDRLAQFGASLRTTGEGVQVLQVGNTRLDLRPMAGSSEQLFAFDRRQIYIQQFKTADQDNNGYLDAKEVASNRLLGNLLKIMDRDGDGQLYEKEMVAYLDRLKVLQDKAIASLVSLTLYDRGQGIFDLLDANRDRRLSVREMRNAPKLLTQMDRDGDGQLVRQEVPRGYELAFWQGPTGVSRPGQVILSADGRVVQQPSSPRPQSGPRWFQKMDRNSDGDVSRREFLGTKDQFQQIDTDGDGILSPEEAERADTLLRQKQEPR